MRNAGLIPLVALALLSPGCFASFPEGSMEPDAARPDALDLDAASPDAALPDAALPDAALLDAALLDAASLDAASPDAASPDAASPDAALPDAALPDAALPDAALPDAALPDAALPDAALPDAGCVPDIERCNGQDDDCDGEEDPSVCGAFVAQNCRAWLGQADNDTQPEQADRWGECFAARRDTDGSTRCVASEPGSFGALSLTGTVDGNDQLAVAFTCESEDEPELAAWVASHCAVYLGHAAANQTPLHDEETWAGCPAADISVMLNYRCVSSGRDSRFYALPMPANFDRYDHLAIAFRCEGEPPLAQAVQSQTNVFLGFAKSPRGDLDLGGQWGDCPRLVFDEGGAARCVASQGDGRFHKVKMTGLAAIGEGDQLGIALFPRTP